MVDETLEGLEQDLNYNAMVSQRGFEPLSLDASATPMFGAAMRCECTASTRTARCSRGPPHAAFPRLRQRTLSDSWGLLQRRGGTARHDAVVWATHVRPANGRRHHSKLRVTDSSARRTRRGRRDDRGSIRAGKVGMAVAGSTSSVARMADSNCDRKPCAAGVCLGGIKPFIPGVVTFAPATSISANRQGGLVFGGTWTATTPTPSAQPAHVEDVCEGGMSLIPAIGRVRLLRSWENHGHVDGRFADHRSNTHRRLHLNAGWCYGGFKQRRHRLVLRTPAGGDEPHEVARAYRWTGLRRHLIDEKGVAPAQPPLIGIDVTSG